MLERWQPPGFEKFMAECITEDGDGNPHFDIPKILKLMDIADTPENREQCVQLLLKVFKEKLPDVKIIIT